MGNRFLYFDHTDSGNGSVPLGDGSLYHLVLAADLTVLRALTNEGVEEFPHGSTQYRVVVPEAWSGTLVWSKGGVQLGAGEFTAASPGTTFPFNQTPPGTGVGRAIRLKRYAMTDAVHYHLGVFRLRVEVADAVGMDPYVFKFRRHDVDAVTGKVLDEFLGVCSPVDVAEYPVGAPNPDRAMPFFRKDFFEIDLRSTKDYQDAWDVVLRQVCVLRDALNRADDMAAVEDVWCGDPPETPSEPSESASTSASTSVSA